MIIYAQGLSRAELGHLHCSDPRIRRDNGRKRLLRQERFHPVKLKPCSALMPLAPSARPAA